MLIRKSMMLTLTFALALLACPHAALISADGSLSAEDQEKQITIDVAQGRITRIRWEDDLLKYVNQGKEFLFDLKSRKHLEVDAKKEIPEKTERKPDLSKTKPPADEKKERKIKSPGRGRQYMTERSPDGRWYAVCNNWNVVLENDDSGESIQVTTDGHRKFRYGTANWVYGEEINVRHGMWWSPDSNYLIFYEFDEQPVKDYFLTSDLTKFNTEVLTEGYMKAGAPNPVVNLLIYDLKKRSLFRADLGEYGDAEPPYLFNMRFTPDGSELLFHRADRLQKKLELMALDYRTGKSSVVIMETQETWQRNFPVMHFLEDGKRFIWGTEATGWHQLVLHHLDGHRLCTLTQGEFPVYRVVVVDEKQGWIYYSAYSDANPLCLQLHKVRLDGTDAQRLTPQSMNHSRFNLSADRKWFTVQYEDIGTPPTTALYSVNGELVCVLAQGQTDPDPLSEIFRFKANDGRTDLYGVLHKPRDFDRSKRYPLVLSVYGGPGSRAVRNSYPTSRRHNRDHYLMARIDNRGTSGRGKAFMGAVYEKLGDVDIGDQADGVRYLIESRPYIDKENIGIVGHSYGGFMAAMGILKFPDLFKAAVVGSAVTDWRHYDSIYTERYMNLPQNNEEGYIRGSCMPYVESLKGHMLIMHGLVDDNVHPNNAWQLIDALNKAGKRYETQFFPKSGHGIGRMNIQWQFFDQHLRTESIALPGTALTPVLIK